MSPAPSWWWTAATWRPEGSGTGEWSRGRCAYDGERGTVIVARGATTTVHVVHSTGATAALYWSSETFSNQSVPPPLSSTSDIARWTKKRSGG